MSIALVHAWSTIIELTAGSLWCFLRLVMPLQEKRDVSHASFLRKRAGLRPASYILEQPDCKQLVDAKIN